MVAGTSRENSGERASGQERWLLVQGCNKPALRRTRETLEGNNYPDRSSQPPSSWRWPKATGRWRAQETAGRAIEAGGPRVDGEEGSGSGGAKGSHRTTILFGNILLQFCQAGGGRGGVQVRGVEVLSLPSSSSRRWGSLNGTLLPGEPAFSLCSSSMGHNRPCCPGRREPAPILPAVSSPLCEDHTPSDPIPRAPHGFQQPGGSSPVSVRVSSRLSASPGALVLAPLPASAGLCSLPPARLFSPSLNLRPALPLAKT